MDLHDCGEIVDASISLNGLVQEASWNQKTYYCSLHCKSVRTPATLQNWTLNTFQNYTDSIAEHRLQLHLADHLLSQQAIYGRWLPYYSKQMWHLLPTCKLPCPHLHQHSSTQYNNVNIVNKSNARPQK